MKALDVSAAELEELLAEAAADRPPAYADAGGRFETTPIGNNDGDALGMSTASGMAPQWAGPSFETRSHAEGPKPPRMTVRDAAQDLREAAYDADEDLVIRRTFLAGAAALAASSAADKSATLEAVRRDLHRSLAAEPTEADVHEWQQITQDYGEAYPIAAPADLIRSLMVDLPSLKNALRQPGSALRQRELLRTGALLSAFTAQSISNLGQPLEAKRWWRTAKHAADRSGDPYSIIWIRGREICHAMGSRPDPVVLRLIEEADSIAVKAPPEATLGLTAMKAQTYALCGRAPDARAALRQIREQFEASPTGYSGSLLAWGEERLYSTESFAYSRLGKIAQAERATRDGLSLHASNDSRNLRHPAGLRLNLAFVLVQSGDIREGLHLAQTVIDGLPEELRGNSIEDGRKLLAIVPRQAQRGTDVQAYREWMNALAAPAGSA